MFILKYQYKLHIKCESTANITGHYRNDSLSNVTTQPSDTLKCLSARCTQMWFEKNECLAENWARRGWCVWVLMWLGSELHWVPALRPQIQTTLDLWVHVNVNKLVQSHLLLPLLVVSARNITFFYIRHNAPSAGLLKWLNTQEI